MPQNVAKKIIKQVIINVANGHI